MTRSAVLALAGPIAFAVAVALLRNDAYGHGTATSGVLVGAEYNPDESLRRPVHYRSWRFVSSGFGMSYGPAARHSAQSRPMLFDNVFVRPEAYDAFLRSGVWPEGTMFVLELRSNESQRQPNTSGYFQSNLRAVEVSVKNSRKYPEGWAYFDFGVDDVSATPQPRSDCFACHRKHAAKDMTFVQFYPTLQTLHTK